MSVNWHEDNRKPQEAGSYYTIIEDVATHDVEVGITTYDESKQQWLIDEQCGRQVKAWAKIEKPCMPENPYVPEEFRKRLMTYMGRTVGEKSLNTLKSEEQKEKELKEKIDAHSKWIRNAGGERLNLDNADLRGMDLSGVIFYKASLNGTNFSGTTLRETNFSEAELKGANFSGAYLKRANFADANVCDTVFENAEIACADFTGAKLNFADLKNANCEHTNFAGANLSHARFVNANCRHAYFGDTKGCANFKDSDLEGVILTSAMEKFYGGWITDTQAITALEPILASGLRSPHLTKKIKRKLRALDKFISRYEKQRRKEEE